MARWTGGGSSSGGGAGGSGEMLARAALTARERRVMTAPHAAQLLPPWFTVSQTAHRHTGVLALIVSAARRCGRSTVRAGPSPGSPVVRWGERRREDRWGLHAVVLCPCWR